MAMTIIEATHLSGVLVSRVTLSDKGIMLRQQSIVFLFQLGGLRLQITLLRHFPFDVVRLDMLGNILVGFFKCVDSGSILLAETLLCKSRTLLILLVYITGQISANISESEHRIIRMLAESEANAVVFVPSAVTFTNAPDVVWTRNFIYKYVASVIQMTAGICNYSHASICLIVLGANSDNIRFVNAQDIYSGKHRDVYLADSDIKDIIASANSDTEISVTVSCDELIKNNYELLPSTYTNVPEVKNAMKLIDATVQMYYSAKLENAKSAKNAIYFVGKRVRLFDPDVELQRSAVVVDLNPEKILAKYAYYFFNSPIGNDVINHGGSGAVNILHHRDVENLDIPAMSIEEQQELITKADNLVHTIEEAQADLDSLF